VSQKYNIYTVFRKKHPLLFSCITNEMLIPTA